MTGGGFERASEQLAAIHHRHRRHGDSFHPSQEPSGRRPSPVISHGWPGSVAEFHKVIDVGRPAAHGGRVEDAFTLSRPLPGYGFSGKPASTGTSVEK